MNYSQLNMGLRFMCGLFMVSIVTGCNNSDKSGNNSTTESINDTTTATTSSVAPGTDT
ncbi:MAG: hypothetical protein H7Y01_01365, partial [Ferruginibacter sp.]|nr:hypothetical protein [Chitinophagaceae bacterium]